MLCIEDPRLRLLLACQVSKGSGCQVARSQHGEMARDKLGLDVSYFVAFSLLLSFSLVKADETPEDGEMDWKALMEESWKPGYMGESKTTLPVRDMPCEGPGTRLETIQGLTWADVKDMLHRRSQHANELKMLASRIQALESDRCCLGIVTTSAYLLPLTMPKPRNMARLLSIELNFLLVNITFFETLHSGFPLFGVYDDLSTSELRTWFQSEESLEYFEAIRDQTHCHEVAATKLQRELVRRRDAEDKEFRPLMPLAVEVFDSPAANCRPAAAAAALVLASARIQAMLFSLKSVEYQSCKLNRLVENVNLR